MQAYAQRARPADRPLRDTVREGFRIAIQPTRRNMFFWAVWSLTFGALLFMSAILLPGQVYGWEIDFTSWVQGVNYPDWAFRLTADRLTNSDTPEGALIITSFIVIFWLLRLRIEAVLVALSVPLHVIANFPKAFVERERPGEIIDGINGFGGMKSFPSGHAEFAITFYGFILYVVLLHIRSTLARAFLISGFVGMVLMVGFARIEVGKHWPLDIVGGYVVGVGLLTGLIWLHSCLRAAQTGKDEATGEP
jgi:undecaprenyl-diphosphatase